MGNTPGGRLGLITTVVGWVRGKWDGLCDGGLDVV